MPHPTPKKELLIIPNIIPNCTQCDSGMYNNFIVYVIFQSMTDYEVENETVTITIPTQGSIPVISINNWIIWQHRVLSSGFDWNRTWDDYKTGFGSHDSLDYWLGLEKLHHLTTSGSYRLRAEWQEAGTDYWFSMEYWLVYIDDEDANYTLHVSGYVHGDDGRAL